MIEMVVDVQWSGESKLKEDGTYETNKKQLKLIFEGVEKYINKEIFSWNFIYKVYFDYIKLNNKEFLCFANAEEDPFIYIICDMVRYEIVDTSYIQ